MKVVIIGATGATGKEVVDLLINDERVVEIVVLVRKALGFTHSKLQEVIVDFDVLDNWLQYIVGDIAISCLGTTLQAAGSKEAQYKVDFDYQYAFSRLAKSNGIPSFILISSSNANSKSIFFYSKMKGELEDSIRDLCFGNTLFLRPGPLVRPKTDRIGERMAVGVISVFNELGLFRSMRPIHVRDLAKLVLHYVFTPFKGIHILESRQIINSIKEFGNEHT